MIPDQGLSGCQVARLIFDGAINELLESALSKFYVDEVRRCVQLRLGN